MVEWFAVMVLRLLWCEVVFDSAHAVMSTPLDWVLIRKLLVGMTLWLSRLEYVKPIYYGGWKAEVACSFFKMLGPMEASPWVPNECQMK